MNDKPVAFVLGVEELLAEHQQLFEHQKEISAKRQRLNMEWVECASAMDALRARMMTMLAAAAGDGRDRAVRDAVNGVLAVVARHNGGVR